METMVRNIVKCAIFFLGYDYYSFQNPGASKDDFFLNALKTVLRQSRVIKICKNAFYVALMRR